MRLNDFGKAARLFRMHHDLALKQMADAMLISSAHLSALEYGDKRLNEGHIETASKFIEAHGATPEEIEQLRAAGGRSMESVNIKDLDGDARAMVYAFARRLQDGAPPTDEINSWLKKKQSNND